MTVQVGIGPIEMGLNDAQCVHKNVQVGIKVRDFGSGNVVIVGVEKKGDIWESVQLLYEFDDTYTPEGEIAKAGNAVSWVSTTLVPRINMWLASRFIPSDVPMDALASIDDVISGWLKWQPQPDGTIKVSL